MVRVVCASVGDVVHDVVGIEAESLRNRLQTLGAERALRVDVECLALTAALCDGQLAGYAERVAQLSLAGTELAKQLCDCASLDATLTGDCMSKRR